MDKKISVIMSAYNENIEWFEKSLISILNQTIKEIEVILIIDNHNNIELINIAKKYSQKDNRIKLLINKENKGLVYCLNKGLEMSTTDIIARMDSDDISELNRLKIQLDYLNNYHNCVLCGTQAIFIDENDNILKQRDIVPNKFKDIKKVIKYRNVFYHPSIMFRKKNIIDIGGYRDIKYAEDYDLITRLILSGKEVHNINKVLLKYRIRNNSITQSNDNIQKNSEKYIKYNLKNNIIDNTKFFLCKDKFTLKDKIIRKLDRGIYKLNLILIGEK